MISILISYFLLLQIAATFSAFVLFLFGKIYERTNSKPTCYALTVLWLIVQFVILIIAFYLSLIWFDMIGIDHGLQHAIIISSILGIVVIIVTPFMYHKLKKGSNELFQDKNSYDDHIYK